MKEQIDTVVDTSPAHTKFRLSKLWQGNKFIDRQNNGKVEIMHYCYRQLAGHSSLLALALRHSDILETMSQRRCEGE